MSNYMIYTDSACDIRPELLRGWNVERINLAFHFEDSVEQTGDKTDIRMFYQKMRDGGVARTTAVNPEAFVRAFEPVLASGRDILYLGFSSGLSATYNSSCIAAEELRQNTLNAELLLWIRFVHQPDRDCLFIFLFRKKPKVHRLTRLPHMLRK